MPVRETAISTIRACPSAEGDVLNSKEAPYLAPSVSLRFGPDTNATVRARIDYAFRVFAGIYGHRVVSLEENADIQFAYGERGARSRNTQELWVPGRYKLDPQTRGTPEFRQFNCRGEIVRLAHGIDSFASRPDWLGELFGWLSGGLESSIDTRDRVSRIPYTATVFHRQEISPFTPHASVLMAWLESALRQDSQNPGLPRPACPIPGVQHLVICSHDIDFCHTTWFRTSKRIAKNLATSIAEHHSTSFLLSNLKMGGRLVSGRTVGDYIPETLDRIESRGFRSTLFAVSQRTHRRDPDYGIQQIGPMLQNAVSRGFEVALHGSYDSVLGRRSLRAEARSLEDVTQQKVIGNRQHWLRFGSQEDLYNLIREGTFTYDSSVGFPTMVGFRSGANFAFPPYDFKHERPAPFLEIPLALMDGALHCTARTLRKDPLSIAKEVMNESRRWGWGGFSILWHNPIEPLQVPPEINSVFWNLVSERQVHCEKWMSGREFLQACLVRYQSAGLLTEVAVDA